MPKTKKPPTFPVSLSRFLKKKKKTSKQATGGAGGALNILAILWVLSFITTILVLTFSKREFPIRTTAIWLIILDISLWLLLLASIVLAIVNGRYTEAIVLSLLVLIFVLIDTVL